ncbi:MAG TPA: hypothetical protein VFN48_01680, partial [Solirubrobacteraceae bacterium]|nr:hypothetical protein [Solirubrobacteraceae bacterium]
MAAIQQLTAGDFSCLDRLLSLLYQPDLSASGAVREVVAQLSELLPERAVYVGHLDPAARRFTIVAAVGAERLGLSDGVCVPQEQSFCFHMARKAAPNLSNDAGG